MPLSGGLGSSAAAYLAGLLAADHLFELDADAARRSPPSSRAIPTTPPPRCGAASWSAPTVDVARFDVPAGLEAVLSSPTSRSAPARRGARCPRPCRTPTPRPTSAYAATLALGLALGDWELVRRGLHDRIHQPYRASLFPRSAALLERAEELGALGATISGAGPTVLFWSHYELTGALVERLSREAEGWATVQRVPFEPMGADVRAL